MSADTVLSWVGAGVSAVSAGFVMWKFWWERPQAQWATQPLKATFSVAAALQGPGFALPPGEPQVLGRLLNVGDGAALNVEVDCADCLVLIFVRVDLNDDPRGIQAKSRVACVPAGGSFDIAVLQNRAPDGKTKEGSTGSPAPAGPVEVRLQWTAPPARARRRLQVPLQVAEDQIEASPDAKPQRVRAPRTTLPPWRKPPR